MLTKVLGGYRHKLQGFTIPWRPLHDLIHQQCLKQPAQYIGGCYSCPPIRRNGIKF